MHKITIKTLLKLKREAERFACLTAYDASFARAQEEAGVEVILVGDSLGMVIKGQESTLSVSMEEMIYHTRNVSRVCKKSMVMADLPFAANVCVEQAYLNSARLIAEGGAQIVKIEGGALMLDTVKFLSERGIAVCSHLGLLPQSINKLGSYRIQGRSKKEAKELLVDAKAMEEAGSDILLLECVPADLAEKITESVSIPVIGIGAGPECDGQVLVCYDMLGLHHGSPASFVKDFLAETNSIQQAFRDYVHQVKTGEFPTLEHVFE